jgi:ribulose-bisphosphate carboxylase large chain
MAVRKRVSRTPPVVRRFKPSFRWNGVELEPYKIAAHRGGEFSGASRQVLIGNLGERVKFHVRYFELEAGGFTSLERHHHAHVVIGIRGRGRVQVAGRKLELRPMDTIYIAPDQAHQLHASGAEPFGFFCIVDARRDRPRPVRSQR